MPNFKREERYYVIKRSHMTPEQDEEVRKFIGRLRHEGHHPVEESVVVESHHPNYEHVWDTVQQIAEGKWDDPSELRVGNIPTLEWAVKKCEAMTAQGFERTRLLTLKRDFENAIEAYQPSSLKNPETTTEADDFRPSSCRERLRENGRPYPKSGCNACCKHVGEMPI